MPHPCPAPEPGFPVIRNLGLTGLLVSFAERMSEPANRAALAFRAALEQAAWEGVGETSTSLASAFVRFDPAILSRELLHDRLAGMLAARDWYAAPLPPGRKLWRIPTVYGTDLAPQLDEAATEAGMTADQAIASLGAARVRVLGIGFAPGQPYLGRLAPEWNLPRQKQLTPQVPEGALVLAIRQLVLFAAPSPTGWRHVGQTAFRCFRRRQDHPFPLTPGDEVIFEPTDRTAFDRLRDAHADGSGGATFEVLD